MSKLKEVIEGWRNHVFPKSKEASMIKEVSSKRMAICNACPFHSKNAPLYKRVRPDAYCTDCGCTLAAKTKSFKSKCPQDKWGIVEVKFK